MIGNEEQHYPILPGMELPHNIKVEVHKGELEHLRQTISDFGHIVEENDRLKEKVASLQRQIATGTPWNPWIPVEDNPPKVSDGLFYIMWEDGCLDTGLVAPSTGEIVPQTPRSLYELTGDEGHSIEWWMPAPPRPEKISPPAEMPTKTPEKAYVVVLKMMDSWCLVGKKVFTKFDDAERFRLRAQGQANKILDTEEVKLLDSYTPPQE